MKKKFIFLILYSIALLVQGQNYFNLKYDLNNQADVSRGIVETNEGYLIAGGTSPIQTIYVMFLNKYGEQQQVKYYNKPNHSYYFGTAGSLIKANQDNYAISGAINFPIPNPHYPSEDYGESLLMLLDSNGDTLWSKTYFVSDSLWNGASQCKQTSDSGFVIIGYAMINPSISDFDFLLIKTDKLGNKQWQHLYGDNKLEMGYSVIQLPDKGYLIGGFHSTSVTPNMENDDPKIIKTDSLGNEKWSKLFGGTYDDSPCVNCLANDSNYMIAYSYCTYQTNFYDAIKKINIIKTDTAGNVIWDRKYGESVHGLGISGIYPVENDGYIVVGSYMKEYLINRDIQVGFLLRIKENGDTLWYKEYSYLYQPHYLSTIEDVTLTSDKGFASSGTIFKSDSPSFQDIWVIKTDSLGCLQPNCHVGITEIKENMGMVIYPNPTKDKITFQINLTNSTETKLVIYNLHGQILMQKDLVQNNTEIDVSLLLQGIYVARVSFGDGSYLQGKFVVVK